MASKATAEKRERPIEYIKVNGVEMRKIKIKMNMEVLNSIISLIYTPSALRTRKVLDNTYKLFNMIDFRVYEKSDELMARVKLIHYTLEARFEHGISGLTMIKQYVADQNQENDNNPLIPEILDDIPKNMEPLDYEDTKYLIKSIQDRVRYGYIVNLKEEYDRIIGSMTFENADSSAYQKNCQLLYEVASNIVNMKRKTEALDSSNQTFSLDQDTFNNVIIDSVIKLQDKNRVFKTGIRFLNNILAPGYQSKRLYCYLALPGGGKSLMLLKSALDIKKYNPDIKPKNPGKIPCVLLITMENDIDETVERIFNMRVTNRDIRNYKPQEVADLLRNEGGLTLTDENNIDIVIKYYPNRSIDTNDLRTIIQDEFDDGREVITLILDYLKRIRPAEKADSEKEELKNITNELKTLAKELDIAVITAQQLNRAAASVVDAALQCNKQDVTKLVGRDGIAGAWEIQENCDMTIIINKEMKTDSGRNYMTFKMLKRRYRCNSEEKDPRYGIPVRDIDYFSHPYDDNDNALIDDINMPQAISVISLMSSFDDMQSAGNARTVIDRPKVKSKKKNSEMGQLDDGSGFDIFNEDSNGDIGDF